MGANKIKIDEIDDAKTKTEDRERYNELEKLIGNQEIRIQSLQSGALQLANYFFVFQGVIVAAISNTNNLTCSDAWFTFSLSLLAALLNLLALLSIASKYVRAMDLHDQTWSDYNRTAGSLYREGEDRPESAKFTRAFSPAVRSNNPNPNLQWRDRFAQRRRYVVLAICMVLFVAFTVVTLVGSWVITCKRDRRLAENRSRGPGSDCLRVCDESGRCMFFCRNM